MTGEDAKKFKEMCKETGESWLKKFAEMTGTIQHLNDNTAESTIHKVGVRNSPDFSDK